MNKLLLLFLILSAFCSRAQTLNVASHNKMDQPVGMVSIHSKCYYLERHGSECCGDDIRVVGIDLSGQTVFTLSLQDNSSYYYNDIPVKIIKTIDNCLMVLCYAERKMCDDDVSFVAAYKNRQIKIDTMGTVLSNVLLTSGPGNVNGSVNYLMDIVQSPNGTYNYSSSSNLGSTHSIAALSNNHILASVTQNSVHSIVESYQGSVVNQQTAPSAIVKFVESSSGTLYALTQQGSIEKYTSGLIFQNSVSVPSVQLTDVALKNDTVFATGFSTLLHAPFYCMISSSLSILYQAQSAYNNNTPVGIAIDAANNVNVIARGSSTDTTITFSSLFKFPKTGSFVSNSDVGVSYVLINSVTYMPPEHYNAGYYYIPPSILLDAAVTVKNYGSDTVKSFCLNHHSDFLSCNNFFKRYNVTLPPGGTTTVQTGVVRGNRIAVTYTTPSNTLVQVEECFFTTVPDDHSDIKIDNDAACSQFMVNYEVGIRANEPDASNISLYPNPFSTSFAVKSTATIKQCFVYTLLGALQRAEVVNAREATLDLAALPAGIYFVKLETEKGKVIKKVVKQ